MSKILKFLGNCNLWYYYPISNTPLIRKDAPVSPPNTLKKLSEDNPQ